MPKKLIVGLGNPGRRYVKTRHNLGFWTLDLLAEKLEAPWRGVVCKALAADAVLGEWRLTLAKPQTYMNLSGESVDCLLNLRSFTPEELLVVCDDVSLPVGKIRLRRQGSSGGNKGLLSITQSLGTEEIPRLRIGTRPLDEPVPDDLADFVLSKFNKGEEAVAAEAVKRAVSVILLILEEDFDVAMNRYNA